MHEMESEESSTSACDDPLMNWDRCKGKSARKA